MPVTPTGPLSLPMESLRVLLANVEAFQTWTGEDDATGAKTRIHLVDLPAAESDDGGYSIEELQALRPGAVIDLWSPERGFGDEPWAATRFAESAYIDVSKLTIDLGANIPEEDARNAADAKLQFLNDTGAVIAGLLDLAGQTAYLTEEDIAAGIGGLVIRKVEIYQLGRSDETKTPAWGDHYRLQLLVHVGI